MPRSPSPPPRGYRRDRSPPRPGDRDFRDRPYRSDGPSSSGYRDRPFDRDRGGRWGGGGGGGPSGPSSRWAGPRPGAGNGDRWIRDDDRDLPVRRDDRDGRDVRDSRDGRDGRDGRTPSPRRDNRRESSVASGSAAANTSTNTGADPSPKKSPIHKTRSASPEEGQITSPAAPPSGPRNHAISSGPGSGPTASPARPRSPPPPSLHRRRSPSPPRRRWDDRDRDRDRDWDRGDRPFARNRPVDRFHPFSRSDGPRDRSDFRGTTSRRGDFGRDRDIRDTRDHRDFRVPHARDARDSRERDSRSYRPASRSPPPSRRTRSPSIASSFRSSRSRFASPDKRSPIKRTPLRGRSRSRSRSLSRPRSISHSRSRSRSRSPTRSRSRSNSRPRTRSRTRTPSRSPPRSRFGAPSGSGGYGRPGDRRLPLPVPIPISTPLPIPIPIPLHGRVPPLGPRADYAPPTGPRSERERAALGGERIPSGPRGFGMPLPPSMAPPAINTHVPLQVPSSVPLTGSGSGQSSGQGSQGQAHPRSKDQGHAQEAPSSTNVHGSGHPSTPAPRLSWFERSRVSPSTTVGSYPPFSATSTASGAAPAGKDAIDSPTRVHTPPVPSSGARVQRDHAGHQYDPSGLGGRDREIKRESTSSPLPPLVDRDAAGGSDERKPEVEKLSAEQLEEIRAKAQEQRVMAELPVLGVSFIGTWENELNHFRSSLATLSAHTLRTQAAARHARAILADVEAERVHATERREVAEDQLNRGQVGIGGVGAILGVV